MCPPPDDSDALSTVPWLPAWVAELSDPRQAARVDEVGDRTVPLAERAIDVSDRLQELLSRLQDMFTTEVLYSGVDRLKTRTDEALTEVAAEIAGSVKRRVDRVRVGWDRRVAQHEAQAGALSEDERGKLDRELRQRLDADIAPIAGRQEKALADQVAAAALTAMSTATKALLGRVEELSAAVTELIHSVVPFAQEGLDLAGELSALSRRARSEDGRVPVSEELRAEVEQAMARFEDVVPRLEQRWAVLGQEAAAVKAAIRAAEESAYSQVAAAIADGFERSARSHVKALDDLEAQASATAEQLIAAHLGSN